MEGQYIPFDDEYGIVGYGYKCPKCNRVSQFTDCEEGCSTCGFSEPYVDQDDWYEEEMGKPVEERAWNVNKTQ
jgi:hypothetical protein